MNNAPNESGCVYNSHGMSLQAAALVPLVSHQGGVVPAPTFGGESKSCGRACCYTAGVQISASEVMNGLLMAASEKILSSSVSALDEHGGGGCQKSVHVVGSGKHSKRFPFRSIFGVLHLTACLVP